MPATSLRYTIRSTIVSKVRIATATAGHGGEQLQVELGFPGDQLKPESIWLEASDGEMNVPVFRGPASINNPTTREDNFTIPLQIKAGWPNQTLDEAEARVVVLFGYLETVLATDPSLSNLTGMLMASIGEVNGPATGRLPEGAVSFIRAVIDVKTRESA